MDATNHCAIARLHAELMGAALQVPLFLVIRENKTGEPVFLDQECAAIHAVWMTGTGNVKPGPAMHAFLDALAVGLHQHLNIESPEASGRSYELMKRWLASALLDAIWRFTDQWMRLQSDASGGYARTTLEQRSKLAWQVIHDAEPGGSLARLCADTVPAPGSRPKRICGHRPLSI
jgi:hypothetical protein